jgi:hypothetical protein
MALTVRLENKFLYSPLIKFEKKYSKRLADEQILTSPLCCNFMHFMKQNA